MEHGNPQPQNCDNAIVTPGGFNITKNAAITMITKWVNTYKQYISPIMPASAPIYRGFFIPIQDIAHLAQGHGCNGVTAYMAIDANNDIKAILVPCNHDKITDTYTDKLCDGGNPNNSLIYDFTCPCPVQCDVKSDLFVHTS